MLSRHICFVKLIKLKSPFLNRNDKTNDRVLKPTSYKPISSSPLRRYIYKTIIFEQNRTRQKRNLLHYMVNEKLSKLLSESVAKRLQLVKSRNSVVLILVFGIFFLLSTGATALLHVIKRVFPSSFITVGHSPYVVKYFELFQQLKFVSAVVT